MERAGCEITNSIVQGYVTAKESYGTVFVPFPCGEVIENIEYLLFMKVSAFHAELPV